MRLFLLLVFILLSGLNSGLNAQSVNSAHCEDDAFHSEVERYLSGTVPAIDAEALYRDYSDYLILDAREFDEFEISHLPGAMFIGYKNYQSELMEDVHPSTPIVVYCSIGYRSEKIGEKLQEMGFQKVHNLYGSLFEWANRGLPLDDIKGQRTTTVHGYNRSWSKWLTNPNVTKVW